MVLSRVDVRAKALATATHSNSMTLSPGELFGFSLWGFLILFFWCVKLCEAPCHSFQNVEAGQEINNTFGLFGAMR